MDKPVKQQFQIQQLVDGNLSHTDRSQWLQTLDDDQLVWRDIALAFVEKQVLDEALSGIGDSAPAPRIDTPKVGGENHRPAKSTRQGTWWAVAASLAMGLWLGSLFFSDHQPNQVASVNQPVPSNNLSTNSPNDHLMLADALARSITPVTPDARRAFLKAGYVVDEQKTVADVQLPSGDLVQLPVRQFNVQYLGNAAYQ